MAKSRFVAIMCRKGTTIQDAMSEDGRTFERAGTDGIVDGLYVSKQNFFRYNFTDRYISPYRRTLRDDGNIWRVYKLLDYFNEWKVVGIIDGKTVFMYDTERGFR